MEKKVKYLLVLIIVLAIVAVALWFGRDFLKEKLFSDNKPAQEQQNNMGEQQPAQQEEQGEETEQTPQGNPIAKTAEIKESIDNYDIGLKYPELSGLSNADAMNGANQALKSKMQQLASDFKKSVAENSAKELSFKSTLSNIYELAIFTNDAVSVRLNILYYVAGMAQPKNYEEVFNYDLKNNKEIKLADLFNSGSNYLSKLSAIGSEDLEKQLSGTNYYSKEAISLGTKPIEYNFSRFVFTKTMLMIIINPGQVSPSNTGIRYIDIPWSKLADISNNNDLVKLITE